MGMEDAWEEYVLFHGGEEQKIDETVREKYLVATENLKELVSFEDALEDSAEDPMLAFNSFYSIKKLITQTFQRPTMRLQQIYRLAHRAQTAAISHHLHIRTGDNRHFT